MPAVRVKDDVHRQLGVVAASENRSVSNYLDTVLRPILARALGDVPPERANPMPSDPPDDFAIPERTKARRGRKAATGPRWMGCERHPRVRAVQGKGDRMMCGEPGCPNLARLIES